MDSAPAFSRFHRRIILKLLVTLAAVAPSGADAACLKDHREVAFKDGSARVRS